MVGEELGPVVVAGTAFAAGEGEGFVEGGEPGFGVVELLGGEWAGRERGGVAVEDVPECASGLGDERHARH